MQASDLYKLLTYCLEGNGPLVLYCYEQIKASGHADAVIRELSVGQHTHLAPLALQLKLYGESCVQPGFDYFFSWFHGGLGGILTAFKAARLFLCELQVDASSVDSLIAFPFLQNDQALVAWFSCSKMFCGTQFSLAFHRFLTHQQCQYHNRGSFCENCTV